MIKSKKLVLDNQHGVKSVHIRAYSGPQFYVFGLNTEKYGVRMRENADQNNSEYGHLLRSAIFEENWLKLQTRNLDKLFL